MTLARSRTVSFQSDQSSHFAQFEVTTFPLERANDAVARAAAHSSPFELTALSA